jgi:hypothetical protein
MIMIRPLWNAIRIVPAVLREPWHGRGETEAGQTLRPIRIFERLTP